MLESENSVSILLPVYNGARHLGEALDSLLSQSHHNFELIVVDDGSVDGSDQIVLNRKDGRIKLIKNEKNMGLISTLNKGVKLCQGRYIARMDADDIAHPSRIERQLSFMLQHPDVGISGTWSRTFGDVKEPWETRYPTEHEDIVAHMIFNTALSHPTVMFDKEKFPKDFIFYSSDAPHAEDYDLWVRASVVTRLANIPELLMNYRVHASQVSSQYANIQKKTARNIRIRLLNRIQIRPTQRELRCHERISAYDWESTDVFYKEAIDWLKRVAKVAKGSGDLQMSRAIRKVTLSKALEMRAQLVKPDGRLSRALTKITWPGMK